MCDYSLDNVQSRAARVGDKLVTTGFPNSNTRGFAPVGEPQVAVCLLPGTEVAFDREVEYDHFLPIFRKRRAGATVAQFRQFNHRGAHQHHDALEFADGQIMLLTCLVPGQRATVLQLPAVPMDEHEAEEQRRVEYAG